MPPENDQKTPEEIAAEAEAARLADEEKTLNDAGKVALQKERDARKAAVKEAADAKAALATLRAEKDAADAAKAQAEADDAKRKGEWEKLANDREAQINTITADRDALKSEHDALTGYFTAQYDAALKELPDVITAFKPPDDAGFAEKATWLATAQEQAKKLTGIAPNGKGPGFRPMPSNGKPTHDEALAQQKRTGKYSA
jgi:hypothetical protein